MHHADEISITPPINPENFVQIDPEKHPYGASIFPELVKLQFLKSHTSIPWLINVKSGVEQQTYSQLFHVKFHTDRYLVLPVQRKAPKIDIHTGCFSFWAIVSVIISFMDSLAVVNRLITWIQGVARHTCYSEHRRECKDAFTTDTCSRYNCSHWRSHQPLSGWYDLLKVSNSGLLIHPRGRIWLWSPYGIGQIIIFSCCIVCSSSSSSSSFFSSPNLSRRRLDVCHRLLPHMVWP